MLLASAPLEVVPPIGAELRQGALGHAGEGSAHGLDAARHISPTKHLSSEMQIAARYRGGGQGGGGERCDLQIDFLEENCGERQAPGLMSPRNRGGCYT